jgi:bacterioferritin-associated ferredoxin
LFVVAVLVAGPPLGDVGLANADSDGHFWECTLAASSCGGIGERCYNSGMTLDDEICYCYHISLRKLVRFAGRERPARASQLADCLGAGTGCGWCIPVLKKIQEQADSGLEVPDDGPLEGLLSAAGEYAAARAAYLKSEEKHSF